MIAHVLKYADETEDKAKLALIPPHFKTGHSNEAPSGLTEITEKELVQSTPWGSHHPELVEFRQIPWKNLAGKDEWTSIYLYFFWDGTGVGMAQDFWAGKLRWFRFGCKHEMFRKGVGKCEHQDTCTKCGLSYTVDSSD